MKETFIISNGINILGSIIQKKKKKILGCTFIFHEFHPKQKIKNHDLY